MSDHSEWSGNGWTQYQKLVLKTLETHTVKLEELNQNIQALNVELAMLKVKAGTWGLIGGMIPITVAILIQKGHF